MGVDFIDVPKIFESEYRFCLILWVNKPINSTKLAALFNEQLGWSKATTYAAIHRLSQRGALKNENATVTFQVSKENVQQPEFEQFVDKIFEGSVPAFLPRSHAAGNIQNRRCRSCRI